MLTALIVDDEPLARDRMRELLAAHRGIEIIGTAGSVKEAGAILETRSPGVVFLDVEMPGGSGLDLLVSVPDATQVVFVTAHEKYAVQAFAAAALDYLVKPVDPERLAETVARLLLQGAANPSPGDDDAGDTIDDDFTATAPRADKLSLDDALSVPLAGQASSAVVTVGDICWIQSLRNYTQVALKGPPRVMLFRRRLNAWDATLPAGPFARVGRSCLIQVATIDQVEWNSRSETRVTFGEGVESLMLGRLPATRLREILRGTA